MSPSRYFRGNSFYQSCVNSWRDRCLRNRFCPGRVSSHILLFLNQPSPQLSPQSRLSWDGAGNKSREYMRPPSPMGAVLGTPQHSSRSLLILPRGGSEQAAATKCLQTLWGIFVKNLNRPQLTVPLPCPCPPSPHAESLWMSGQDGAKFLKGPTVG